MRPRHGIAKWEAALAGVPLRITSQGVINDEVRRGLELTTPQLLERIDRRLPSFLRALGRASAHIEGSPYCFALQSGDLSYRVYSFVKDCGPV
jgi:fatty-acid O-methyltransferase